MVSKEYKVMWQFAPKLDSFMIYLLIGKSLDHPRIGNSKNIKAKKNHST
jgi:hypothetical protein